MDALFYASGITALTVSLLVALRVGFYVGKHSPYNTRLRDEVLRRVRIMVVYAKVTLGVIIPAYGRRLRRKRAEAIKEYLDNLAPIKTSFTKDRK